MVVPTLNEELYLQSCLQAILNQSYPCFEILVVDAYSDDHTAQIGREMGARVILSRKRSPGAQRNLGAKLAEGEIIVFIDADTVVSENLLEEFYRVFNDDKRVVGLFPKLLPSDGKIIDEWLFWLLRNSLKLGSLFGVSLTPGACCAYRRECFLEAGGFAEDINGEDSELSLKIKKLGNIETVGTCYAKTSLRRLEAQGRMRWVKGMIASTLPFLLMTLID